jgi:putative MATE family efflux protein
MVSPEDPMSPMSAVIEAEAPLDDEGTIRSGKLAGLSINRAIWVLSWPVLLQQVMAACVGLVDKMVGGSLPDGVATPALDGIGIGAYVGWFIGIALMGVGVGAQAIIARAMGAGDPAGAQVVAGRGLALGLAWGSAVGIVLWFAVVPLAELCELHGRSAEFCIQYTRINAIAMPFLSVMSIGSMILHGAGETTKPSVISAWVNVVNVVLSILLSGVEMRLGSVRLPNLLGIDATEWGVSGIAIGTVIGYAVGAWMTWRVLRRGVKDLRLERHDVRLDRSTTWRIARVGIPNFFEGVTLWAVNLFVMAFIGMISVAEGVDGVPRQGLVGAHMIAVQWEAFSFLPGFAMGTAAGALAGQFLGAGSASKARTAIWRCNVVGMAIMGAFGIAFMTLGGPLTRIISEDPVHVREVPSLLFICGLIQVFFAMAMVIRNGIRGAGDTTWVLAITFVSCYGLRLPLAWLLGVKLGKGLTGIWIGLCTELAVRGLLFLARFLHGGWARAKV